MLNFYEDVRAIFPMCKQQSCKSFFLCSTITTMLYTLDISRLNITRYWSEYNENLRTLFRLRTRQERPISRPYGWVMGRSCWIRLRKMISTWSLEENIYFACQSVGSGILRGLGRQALGAGIALAGYPFALVVGVPCLFMTRLSVAGKLQLTQYGPWEICVEF